MFASYSMQFASDTYLAKQTCQRLAYAAVVIAQAYWAYCVCLYIVHVHVGSTAHFRSRLAAHFPCTTPSWLPSLRALHNVLYIRLQTAPFDITPLFLINYILNFITASSLLYHNRSPRAAGQCDTIPQCGHLCGHLYPGQPGVCAGDGLWTARRGNHDRGHTVSASKGNSKIVEMLRCLHWP